MDKYTETAENIYRNIDMFKIIYEAGNMSISNFFRKIKIEEIENKKKQASQNSIPSLIYDICDFHSECQSKNQINHHIFEELEKGLSNLKDIYAELQEDLRDKTKHIAEICEENKQLQNEKEAEIQQIKERLYNDIQQEIQQLKQENAQYLKAFNNVKPDSKSERKLKEQIANLIEENKSLKKTVSLKKKELNDLSYKLKDFSKKYEKLYKEYSNTCQQVKYLDKSVKEKDNFISQAKRSCEAKDNMISAKDKMLQIREKKIDELKMKIDELQQNNSALDTNSRSIFTLISQIFSQDSNDEDQNKSPVQNNQKQISEIESQNVILNSKIKSLQKVIDAKNDQINKLSQDIHHYEDVLSDKDKQIYSIVQKYNDLKSEKENMNLDLLKNIANLEEEIKDNYNSLDNMESEKKQLEKRVFEINASNRNYKIEIKAIKEEMYRLEEKIMKSDENEEEFKKLIKTQKEEMYRLEEKIMKSDENEEEFKKLIKTQKDEMNRLKEKIINSDKNEEEFKKLIETQKDEMNKLKEKIDELEVKKKRQASQSQQDKNIEIINKETFKNIEKGDRIGIGNTGIIYKVAKKVFYALKEMKPQITTEEFQKFIAEYEVMRILEHPNIVKTYGIYLSDEKNPPSILLELCPSNLDFAIKNKKMSKVQLVFSIYQNHFHILVLFHFLK